MSARHFLNGSINCDCTRCAEEKKIDEDKEKKKLVVKMSTPEEFEKKLNEIEASFKKQGITDEDELIEELRLQIEDMKNEGKKGSKDASRKYSVLGYDSTEFNHDATAGDSFLRDLGSVD